tara:strand:+ start:6204 stop:6455 length:252 start_codon:yes stop_codon:yes gene_type:complete
MNEKYKTMICYLSEVGHKNFLYPSESTAILCDDCELEKLNYVGGGPNKLIAVRVNNECISPYKIGPETCAIIKKGYSVVWINQ